MVTKTKLYSTELLLACFWCLARPVQATEDFRPILYAAEGAGKIIRYDNRGDVVWEYPAAMSRDTWALPSGNILFCFNQQYHSASNNNPSGVIEVTPDKRVVFTFSTTGQVWSCQRMADGNTLVGAASQGKLLIVNPQAKILKTIQVLNTPGHSCMRNARQLDDGHFLVAEESAHAAREYSVDGALLREIKLSFAPFSAVRLKNGNTLVCGEQTIVVIDPADKITWSMSGKELPESGIRWFAGVQALPNGNIFVCNAGGKVPFLEISKDKNVVWQSPSNMTIPLGHGIQRLDIPEGTTK